MSSFNAKTFEGQTDAQLLLLLSAVSKRTDGAKSDEEFMEAIRKELIQRDRVRQGKKRTWGEPDGTD